MRVVRIFLPLLLSLSRNRILKARLCRWVDDSPLARQVGREIVESLGFRCLEAEDGQEALRSCRAEMPHVVLLDWNMPVMTGYDFLLALRGLPQGGEPVIIFCTTETERPQIVKAMQAGADEYIMKPFDKSILHDKFVQTGLLS